MEPQVAIVSGAIFGLMGCLAPAILFGRALRGSRAVSLTACLAAMGVTFLTLTYPGILAAQALSPMLPCAVGATYLGRYARRARSGTGAGEGAAS